MPSYANGTAMLSLQGAIACRDSNVQSCVAVYKYVLNAMNAYSICFTTTEMKMAG